MRSQTPSVFPWTYPTTRNRRRSRIGAPLFPFPTVMSIVSSFWRSPPDAVTAPSKARRRSGARGSVMPA
jgi:hypothetical protein